VSGEEIGRKKKCRESVIRLGELVGGYLERRAREQGSSNFAKKEGKSTYEWGEGKFIICRGIKFNKGGGLLVALIPRRGVSRPGKGERANLDMETPSTKTLWSKKESVDQRNAFRGTGEGNEKGKVSISSD